MEVIRNLPDGFKGNVFTNLCPPSHVFWVAATEGARPYGVGNPLVIGLGAALGGVNVRSSMGSGSELPARNMCTHWISSPSPPAPTSTFNAGAACVL